MYITALGITNNNDCNVVLCTKRFQKSGIDRPRKICYEKHNRCRFVVRTSRENTRLKSLKRSSLRF